MDTMEKQTLEGAAAIMAGELLTRPGVRAVQLIDVPHHTDGPPYYVGPEFRLLVVVDGELAEEYKERLGNPAIIHYQDGDDNGHTWMAERTESPREAACHLLGIPDEESFYDNLSSEHGFSFYEIHVYGVIDIVLVPENWTTQDGWLLLERLGTDAEGNCSLNNYRVFDPNTRTFVSPS